MFVDSDHGHDKVTGRSSTELFSVVVSTPTTWSSKRQTTVQTSTFGAKVIALKKSAEESIMLRYHLISMGIKVYKPTPIFVESISVVLNATNPGSTVNNKTVVLSYRFVRGHVANNVVEVRKIHTSENISYSFTKPLTSNYFQGLYYECTVNG